MRATENASRNPVCLLIYRYGVAEIIDEAMSVRIRSNRGLFLEILAKVDDPKAQWSGMPSPVSRAYILHGKAAPVLQRDELVLRACAAATQAAMKAHDSDEGD